MLMNNEMDEETIDEVILQPNDFAYRKYQKFTGLFIAGVNEHIDKDNPDFGTTDIALPDGNLNYRFDEGVQGWRGMTSDELDVYLASICIPVPTTLDEMQAAFTGQINVLTKQLVMMTTGNTQITKQMISLSQTLTDLNKRLTELEKEDQQTKDNGGAK